MSNYAIFPRLASTAPKSILLSALLTLPSAFAQDIYLAQGLLAGEPSESTVILQTRLTSSPIPIEGDVPGMVGVGQFEISTSPDFKKSTFSEWINASNETDFILKTKIDSLKPTTTYHYRVIYGSEKGSANPSSAASFKTLPTQDQSASIQFVLTSCLNYAFFQNGDKTNSPAKPEDRALGYPALEPIAKLKPDFIILNGDCVYYDHPAHTAAKTRTELRKKWHEQYVMPRFVKLFSQTPTYWLKDDHDHRYNDSDLTGEKEPSNELGIATFREQVPIVDPKSNTPTYRTHRMGKDLQLWFVEGRDYRSPNKMPDGPEKSLWGKEQREWLQRTIKESNATFKILISPTPMIGPDDGYKSDNHANIKGFAQEGQAFFEWLKTNDIDPNKFFILCGDRHWKYHTIHPHGFTEFSCGALNKENARLGRIPGDPKSNDPDAKFRQPYTDKPACGGFLHIDLKASSPQTPATLSITLQDDSGKTLHQHQVK
ncbi:MAG: alkaline phosphatase D family protein [Akkermansiaceae bacterium]